MAIDILAETEKLLKKIQKPSLTLGQKTALDAMLAGENVFLTGNAGTGKSFVLQEFLKCVRRKNIITCAPTGIAALRLRKGTTIHRAFHLPFLQAYDFREHNHPTEEILNADIIIIDEISMCRVDLFDYIAEIIFEAEEKSGKPKQVIVVGDFFQLPPVLRSDERSVLRYKYPNIQAGFCFAGVNWSRFNFKPFVLTEVIRQNDTDYIEMLNLARRGNPECLQYFNDCKLDYKAEGGGICLVPTNAKATAINKTMLSRLDGDASIFVAKQDGVVNVGDKTADDELVLKKGARVIALCNSQTYRNGQIGTVKKIHDTHVSVEWDNGHRSDVEPHDWQIMKPKWDGEIIKHEVIGTFSQIPLRLAYAITIHKSQGQTYAKANVDPACFDIGQLYVALSRCESIEGLSLMRKIYPSALRTSPEVCDFYDNL